MSTGSGNSGSQGKVREINSGQGSQGKVREFGNFREKSGKIGILASLKKIVRFLPFGQFKKNGNISAEITCIELHFQVIL